MPIPIAHGEYAALARRLGPDCGDWSPLEPRAWAQGMLDLLTAPVFSETELIASFDELVRRWPVMPPGPTLWFVPPGARR